MAAVLHMTIYIHVLVWKLLYCHWKSFPRAQPRIIQHSSDSKVHGVNMGPTWVLSAPGGPHETCYEGVYRWWLTNASLGFEELTPLYGCKILSHFLLPVIFQLCQWPLWDRYVTLSHHDFGACNGGMDSEYINNNITALGKTESDQIYTDAKINDHYI